MSDTVQHATTLVWKRRNSDGCPWKIACLCGYRTVGQVSRQAAQAMGNDHLANPTL
jgi:hypothetical protein